MSVHIVSELSLSDMMHWMTCQISKCSGAGNSLGTKWQKFGFTYHRPGVLCELKMSLAVGAFSGEFRDVNLEGVDR